MPGDDPSAFARAAALGGAGVDVADGKDPMRLVSSAPRSLVMAAPVPAEPC